MLKHLADILVDDVIALGIVGRFFLVDDDFGAPFEVAWERGDRIDVKRSSPDDEYVRVDGGRHRLREGVFV